MARRNPISTARYGQIFSTIAEVISRRCRLSGCSPRILPAGGAIARPSSFGRAHLEHSLRRLLRRAWRPDRRRCSHRQVGLRPRMFFSWYSGDFTADPEFADPSLSPEQRANPSFASLADGGIGYLAQQRARLPTTQYRRLHPKLPGSLAGAAYAAEALDAAIPLGYRQAPPRTGRHGFRVLRPGRRIEQ